ncbi:SHOCT domain-containing protein [Streptomyces monticola]|uniref:SHOCT domain-containing protein n=1 Tax=Streptomyces monticola TaxID=2666263 RepID=A0ABW2JR68_9ACTN
MLVGGTAYAAGRSAARNAQREQDQSAAIQDLQAQQAQQAQQQSAPQPPAVPTAVGVSVADQLMQLGQLVQQGLLSPDEFAAAKAKLLGS